MFFGPNRIPLKGGMQVELREKSDTLPKAESRGCKWRFEKKRDPWVEVRGGMQMNVGMYELEQFVFLTNWTPPPYKFMDLALKLHPPLRKGKGPTIRNYPWGGGMDWKRRGASKIKEGPKGGRWEFWEVLWGASKIIQPLVYLTIFLLYVSFSRMWSTVFNTLIAWGAVEHVKPFYGGAVENVGTSIGGPLKMLAGFQYLDSYPLPHTVNFW